MRLQNRFCPNVLSWQLGVCECQCRKNVIMCKLDNDVTEFACGAVGFLCLARSHTYLQCVGTNAIMTMPVVLFFFFCLLWTEALPYFQITTHLLSHFFYVGTFVRALKYFKKVFHHICPNLVTWLCLVNSVLKRPIGS